MCRHKERRSIRAIRKIQVEVAEAGPRMAWVNTDDLNDVAGKDGQGTRNDLHYSSAGYETFGTRLAEAAIRLIKEPSRKPQ